MTDADTTRSLSGHTFASPCNDVVTALLLQFAGSRSEEREICSELPQTRLLLAQQTWKALGIFIGNHSRMARQLHIIAESLDFQSQDVEVHLHRRRLPWQVVECKAKPTMQVTLALPCSLPWVEPEQDFWGAGEHFFLSHALTEDERRWLCELELAHSCDTRIAPRLSASNESHSQQSSHFAKGSGLVPAEDRARLLTLSARLARHISVRANKMQFLDLVTISRTAMCGHAPHVDNEMEIRSGSGEITWVPNNSGHRRKSFVTHLPHSLRNPHVMCQFYFSGSSMFHAKVVALINMQNS